MKTAQYTANSAETLISYAQSFARAQLRGVRLVTCAGPLGAGKTTFIQGLAKGLGVRADVSSPTFTLINEYKIPGSARRLVHFDLYRIAQEKDLGPLHLYEYLEDPYVIMCVEWADQFPHIWKNYPRIAIRFLLHNKNKRRLLISYHAGR